MRQLILDGGVCHVLMQRGELGGDRETEREWLAISLKAEQVQGITGEHQSSDNTVPILFTITLKGPYINLFFTDIPIHWFTVW